MLSGGVHIGHRVLSGIFILHSPVLCSSRTLNSYPTKYVQEYVRLIHIQPTMVSHASVTASALPDPGTYYICESCSLPGWTEARPNFRVRTEHCHCYPSDDQSGHKLTVIFSSLFRCNHHSPPQTTTARHNLYLLRLNRIWRLEWAQASYESCPLEAMYGP